MGRIRNHTLGRIFMGYVLAMLGAFFLLGACTVLAFNILVNTGSIYPANYAEQKISEAYDRIQSADEVTGDMIPPLCRYIIFSADGEKLGGDLSGHSAEIAWDVANHRQASGNGFYKVVIRPKEYVVIRYSLMPQYRSAFLREHFIGPQDFMAVVVILGGTAIIISLSACFGRKIRRKMQPVMRAVERIKEQDLAYGTSCSGIKEFDDCLSSIDDMRIALKDSLERQWKAEQDKNRQISALAHDIKTPLTVVRGNAELLYETELTEEQQKNIVYILDSAAQIENYAQRLIDAARSADGGVNVSKEVRTEDIFSDIKKQAEGLAEACNIKIIWKERQNSETVNAAYDQVVRAVMNIVQNAAEHTEEGGTIHIVMEEKKGELTFLVEDAGRGFTEEALRHGTEPFFMDDTGRSGGAHYGIGLFFAKTAAETCGGRILLANSEETGGAKVAICFRS